MGRYELNIPLKNLTQLHALESTLEIIEEESGVWHRPELIGAAKLGKEVYAIVMVESGITYFLMAQELMPEIYTQKVCDISINGYDSRYYSPDRYLNYAQLTKALRSKS